MPKAMYRYELANAVGVSERTLRVWLKNDKKKLQQLGVTDKNRLLTPAAVKFICEKYVIEL